MSLFYRSTRDDSVKVTASQAILKGLAPDGGLFVPESIPTLDKSLEELSKMSYADVAYEVMTKEQFAQQDFFERTMYAGVHYGTKKEDIQAVLDDGKYAVMSLDMCGAIAMKRHFPTAIIYVAKDKEDMIADIVQSDFPVGEKTLRLLSLDAEKRNREICDFVIDNRDEQGSERILQLLNF